MKKLFAFLLVLAMLIPMGTIAQAEEAVGTKPFYMLQWGEFQSDLTNVYNMPFVWTNKAFLNAGNILGSTWVSLADSYDVHEVAAALADQFATQPAGSRGFIFCLAPDAFRSDSYREDIVFVDKGVAAVQLWLHEFLKTFKANNGQLDHLVIDIEFEDLYATYIHSRYAVKDPLIYKKIVDNPLYATDIRPKLEERGFKFFPNVTDETPEIFSIHPSSGDEYKQSRSIWDAVLRSYINGKVTEACKEVWDYYPDCIVSDYQSKNIRPWLKELSDAGGVEGVGGNFEHAGNSSNENTYSVRPYSFWTTASQAPKYATLPGYNKAVYDNVPFSYFMYDINLFKNNYLAANGVDVSYWIAHHLYNTKNENSPSETPYYVETILHTGLLDPSNFMGYIIKSEVGDAAKYELALQIVDDAMKELTRVVGAADRKPLDVATDWNSKFLLSGMYAGGSNYYRITPDTTVISLEDFKVADAKDPTFRVNGETVTFPGGEIITDGNVRELGTCGYWIKTATDVKPVITRDANYWTTYPTYQETYDGFEVGTEYTFKTALPTACWEVKKNKDSIGTIAADPLDPNNKVLALKGTYNMANVNLPKNVTAGDTYAEHQAWEITVQVPADMAAEAEVTLLRITNEKRKPTDGGVKIVGGKLYYDNAGAYVEMENVAITAGAKYKIVREMNFTNPEAVTCSYYVYDGTGALIGRAKNVPATVMDVPVFAINLGVTGVTGEAVLLDNYKLYPTKVGYDFELYNADTGIQYTDITTPLPPIPLTVSPG